MKRILTLLIILISVNSFSQDSVKIKISLQARDCKYIASVSSKETEEEYFDATKSKFRVALASVPTGTTLVSVDSMYTIDLLRIWMGMQNDPLAIKSGLAGRMETVLRNVNQAYLNSKIDAAQAADISTFQTMQNFGLFRYRKTNN